MVASKNEGRALPSDSEIIERIQDLAIDVLNLSPNAFNGGLRPDDSLVNTLELDSVARLELLFAVEDAYGVTIELEDGVKLETVGDLVGSIRKGLSGDRQTET